LEDAMLIYVGIFYLSCFAVFLELVDRAPVMD